MSLVFTVPQDYKGDYIAVATGQAGVLEMSLACPIWGKRGMFLGVLIS